MLTAEVAESFLTDRLGLTDWKLLNQEASKAKLVEQIVLAFSHNLYFQNLTWAARPKEKRCCPTPEEAVAYIFGNEKGNGGCCLHLNYALVLLLQYLGLDAFLIGADEWMLPGLHDTHVLVIWKVDDVEKYAMDVGYPRPMPGIIPLHKLPFERKVGGFTFKMSLNSETGYYERILLGGCPGYGPLKDFENGQRKEFYFKTDLTPRPFNYFDGVMTPLFVNVESTNFLQATRMMRLLRVESPEDFDYVCIVRKNLSRGTATEFNQTKYPTYISMFSIIMELFPKMDEELLKTALVKFDDFEQSAERQIDIRE